MKAISAGPDHCFDASAGQRRGDQQGAAQRRRTGALHLAARRARPRRRADAAVAEILMLSPTRASSTSRAPPTSATASRPTCRCCWCAKSGRGRHRRGACASARPGCGDAHRTCRACSWSSRELRTYRLDRALSTHACLGERGEEAAAAHRRGFHDAIPLVQEGIIVDANPAWLELFGYVDARGVVGSR